jgi:hypothetical protein
MKCFFKARRNLWLVVSLVAFLAAGTHVLAQTKKGEPELRTVHGSVVDDGENPAPTSVVYLRNAKTQAVRTYIADDGVDYQIHAEHSGATSSTRTISSFDTRHDITLILKLSRKK